MRFRLHSAVSSPQHVAGLCRAGKARNFSPRLRVSFSAPRARPSRGFIPDRGRGPLFAFGCGRWEMSSPLSVVMFMSFSSIRERLLFLSSIGKGFFFYLSFIGFSGRSNDVALLKMASVCKRRAFC